MKIFFRSNDGPKWLRNDSKDERKYQWADHEPNGLTISSDLRDRAGCDWRKIVKVSTTKKSLKAIRKRRAMMRGTATVPVSPSHKLLNPGQLKQTT